MQRNLNRSCVALFAVAVFAVATTSQATVITLTGGDATDGWVAPASPVLAYNVGGFIIPAATETIQGITFTGWPSGTTAPSSYSFGGSVKVTGNTSTFGASAYTAPSYSSPTANDTAMSALMGTIFYNYNSSGTGPLEITISGLTSGASYLLDAFTFSDGVSPRANETITVNGTQTDQWNMVGGTSYLVADTVTAPSGNIVLDVYNYNTSLSSGGTPILSGFAISAVPAPEPSSVVLLGLGAALLAWKTLRRRA